ncbi:hypothetical protein DRE_01264 [Drechslerella stenobrocha 248]|uniref:CFEM domain-containing protein n=1 Tax=Drechslerella stenobrocha 248 TaxID=1043628 RepID=W7HV24_9PEZI|nr:hypothetical protein DRE_01264 [Drechslerella stenobrocha 248]
MYRRKTFASLREEMLDRDTGNRESYNRPPYQFQPRQRPFSSSFAPDPQRGRLPQQRPQRYSMHGATVDRRTSQPETEFDPVDRKQQRHSRAITPPPTKPMRLLNLAGYTGKDGKYFYPACAYDCLDDVPDKYCSPAGESCICANTRLLDELGVCVKLECVHGGDMHKFWRVMGRECEGIHGVGGLPVPLQYMCTGIVTDLVIVFIDVETDSERRPYTYYYSYKEKEEREWERECRRRMTLLEPPSSTLTPPRPHSPATTQMSDEPALTITVTKTVSVEVQSLKSVDTTDCRTIRTRGPENGEVGSGGLWDKSFFCPDDDDDSEASSGGTDWDWDYEGRGPGIAGKRPGTSRTGTSRPPTARPATSRPGTARTRPPTRGRNARPYEERPREPVLPVNASCHEVVGFLKKFGITPKKVAGMVKKVKSVFGRATT